MNLFKQLAVSAIFAASVGAAGAATTLGGGGAALQGVLDGITVGPVAGSSSVNVNTDQYGLDEVWQIGGSGGSVTTFIIQLAGFAGVHKFGIYDSTDSSKKVQLFGGAGTPGDQALVSILATGQVRLNGSLTGTFFAANSFGYYLDNGNGDTWYSQSALNGGDDHMVAYEGGRGDTIQIPSLAAGPWNSNEFIIAFEDLPFASSDFDYTDFVALVESVSGIPEPGTLGLLGLSLAGLGLMTRRRRAQ